MVAMSFRCPDDIYEDLAYLKRLKNMNSTEAILYFLRIGMDCECNIFREKIIEIKRLEYEKYKDVEFFMKRREEKLELDQKNLIEKIRTDPQFSWLWENRHSEVHLTGPYGKEDLKKARLTLEEFEKLVGEYEKEHPENESEGGVY